MLLNLPTGTVGIWPGILFLEGVWYDTFNVFLHWLLRSFHFWITWWSGTSVASGAVLVSPYLESDTHSVSFIGSEGCIFCKAVYSAPLGPMDLFLVLHWGFSCSAMYLWFPVFWILFIVHKYTFDSIKVSPKPLLVGSFPWSYKPFDKIRYFCAYFRYLPPFSKGHNISDDPLPFSSSRVTVIGTFILLFYWIGL